MPEPSPPDQDALDQGLAAAFGPDSGPPLPAHGSVLKALTASLPDVPHVQLRDPDSGTAAPVERPSSGEMPARHGPDARLQLHGEIARGGMGAVLKGRDADLGREVAVKVLLESHHGKTELARRFVEEAQIAGQLQHPGIVPVYELGQFADRRPYFTMKLVKGRTFAALLAARKSPEEDRTRFVGIFGQVCQAVAYAHARGVIHRDLKPSNVMVGAFGEVQVMDWGLAKVLAEGGVADEQNAQPQEVSVIRTQRSTGSDGAEPGSHTQAGSVLGTPAYMAPEQARGEVGLVDERADVFGLGAILCEILTGRPAFTGSGPEVVRRARTGSLADAQARLDGCGADAELVGLARRCLAAEPWDRPRCAGEVAEALAAYQNSVAERLRLAEVAQAAEAARAEEAKATAEQERRARAAAQAQTVAERRARRLTVGLAASVLLLAVTGAGAGLWAQRQQAEREAEEARRRRAVEAALDKAHALQQQARWAEARAVLDQTRDRLGEAGPEDLRQQVKQAGDDLALVDRLETIRLNRAAVVGGNFDNRTAARDYAAAFRDAGLAREGAAAEVVAARIRASAVAAQLVAALDDFASVAESPERRAWLLTAARRADPDAWRDRCRDPRVWGDPAALRRLAAEVVRDQEALDKLGAPLLAVLGQALLAAGGDAVPLLTAAQARRPEDFWLNYLLGKALAEAKRAGEAVGFFRGAVAVRPDSSAAHNGLGAALHAAGRPEAAIAEFRAAVALNPRHAKAHSNLGASLHARGRLDEAIAAYRAAVALAPQNAPLHYNLGMVLYDKKDLSAAIREYRHAIALDPSAAAPHINLGIALRAAGRPAEGLQEFRAAVHKAPKDPLAHYNLGNALRDAGQAEEAIRAYRTSLALNPKNAQAHFGLGAVLHKQGRLDEAVREFRAATALDPRLVAAHHNLGNALQELKRFGEAIQAYRATVALGPEDAKAHNNLASALVENGAFDEAIRECRVAIKLDGQLAHAYYNLGLALRGRGCFAEALEALEAAQGLGSAQTAFRRETAKRIGQVKPLADRDRRVLAVLNSEAKAKGPSELLGLANFCLAQKRHSAAAAGLYAEAFAAEPALADDLDAGDRYRAAQAAVQAGTGQGNGATVVGEPARARWRKQALAWLRADLGLWQKRGAGDADDRGAVMEALGRWQRDPSLAAVRDGEALEKLPAAERGEWQRLWAAAAALLKRARVK